MRLSILIPVYNEEKTVGKTIQNVLQLFNTGLVKEVIVIDDGSTDMSGKEIEKVIGRRKNVMLLSHTKNKGKGAAIRTGIKKAQGDYIVIQDADWEYNPSDIIKLMEAVTKKNAVVFGTRLRRMPHLNKEENHPLFLLHFFGNRMLSFMVSILYGQWLTDIETCYKLFPRHAIKPTDLSSDGFDIEVEVTTRLLKKGFSIKEVPITTTPRGYKQGKKLHTIQDGLVACWSIWKYRFFT